MALLPLAILSLAASAQASPLWGLVRRSGELCNNPDVSTSASLVLTGVGDAIYTFTPSRVSDVAQWTLQTPVTITDDASTTETIYPFGYIWALSGTPGTLEIPALPTTDVPYPLPDGASATLCNAATPINTPTTLVFRPEGSTTTITPTSVNTETPPATTIATDDPTEDPSIPLGLSTTPGTDTAAVPSNTPQSGETTTTTLGDDTTTTQVNNTPTTITTAEGVTSNTEQTETPGTTTTTEDITSNTDQTETPRTTTTTEGTTTGTDQTETPTSDVTTEESTTVEPTSTETTGTETAGTPTSDVPTGTETTSTETTGTETTGTPVDTTTTDTAATDTETTNTETTGETTSTDTTTTDQTTTGETTTETTTTESSGETTTTDSNGDTTTSEEPDPSATSFPTYDPPTATVTGPAATSEAVEIGPLLWSLWNNRDMIKDDDEEKKKKYIEETEETRDDIVLLWTNFDIKPEVPVECGQTALKKRSLISGVIDLLDTAAKLIGCAEKVVNNLVDQVKLPDPPIDVIITLTDTLKDISEELEKEDDKPTETEEISTTEEPTSTTATTCTASGVESCSQTVFLTTSFYKDGDVDTSTVQTITTEACVTVTGCDAQATTDVTTVTTTTSDDSGIVCDYDCTACVGSNEKRAAPTSHASLEERKLDDIPLYWGTSDGDKSNYIMDMINVWEGDKEQLDWVFANFDLVSGHGSFGDVDMKRWVVGLVGCTGIAIVSKTGWWLSHFMEPGFISGNKYDISRWDNRIIAAMNDGSARYTKPDDLTGDGDILNLGNDPIIYLSTPVDASGARLYNDKVNIIMDKLTGDGAPFAGVEVKELGYRKPDGDVQQGLWQNSAHGKIMIEFTPNQIDDDEDFNEVTPDPREKMTRVWQEFTYWERRIAIYGEPQCQAPSEDASGADPATAKELAQLFCEGKDVDFGSDAELTLGGGDLDPTVDLKADFKFTFTKRDDGECAQSCTDIYNDLIGSCQYNSHLFTGEAHITYECGKYGLEAIAKPDDTGSNDGGSTQPEVRDNCADSTVYTKFTLDQATQAIDDFCSHDISLPSAAQPVKKTYQYDDVTLQLWTQWSSKGQDGCNDPSDQDAHLSGDACRERFLGAVNDCNTDSTTDKFGNYPYIWNSPNGCIDFWIYGNGDDFNCDEIFGTVPLPCQDSGITLD
ncbi:hypothetical protein B0T10DRAFT_513799 [Thelonectria olida]|uniref:Uncharacterized protein n=1 Tax=Thelonectria olida TaxID=1576542 RepID=A0A9P8W4T3_9HYPO|nr:hypothetical protein B0T10DRAFT_513799 [Thelonectria olida]